jgi:NAD(P)-dependent dehydrogenase (short-subunit alcohol dehydrogenase family)
MKRNGTRLQRKVALVVGAGSVGPGWGNGKAAAVLFAREGAKVFAVDVNAEAALETAAIIREDGGQVASFEADVTQPQDVARLVGACIDAYGRIDVLLNNVGGSAPGGVVEMSEEVWSSQMDHNLNYVFLTMKHVLPVMERQHAGSIINLASIAALAHFGPNVAAYAASKAGLIHLTRVTAIQYARKGIRCNTIVPGLMHTPLVEQRLSYQRADGDLSGLIRQRHDQVPMGRMGDAWDVAHAALFLASDDAKYITATEIVVDGGLAATSRQPPGVPY